MISFLLGGTLFCCKKTSQEKLSLMVKIKGFKKGTAFLEGLKNNQWVVIDSIKVLKNPNFVMGKKLAYPQILRFSIDQKKQQTVTFFAENKPMTLEASLEKMNWKSKVSGSKNDSILKLFEKQMKELRFRRLKLIKEKIAAMKEKNTNALKTIEKKERAMLKNEYLFGINFIARERNYEVAPYLATNHLKEVNNHFLKKILDTLPSKIRNSFYGLTLEKIIQNRPVKKIIFPQ